MLRLVVLPFLLVLLQSGARADASAPCALQRASAAGSHVWLLCDRREVFVSADEGRSWRGSKLPADGLLRDIAALDSRRAFVVGDAGLLLATADGGETWKRVPLPVQENLTSIRFAGEHGWIAGWMGVILHSPDGGATWQRQHTGVLHGLENIFFADQRHGWAVGWAGTILRTTDGGQTWREVRLPQTLWSLDSVFFRDPLNGWAVGFNGQILRSRDGGVTWQEVRSPTQAWMKSVAADRAGRVWIATNHELLLSTDDGQSWKSLPIESLLFLRHLLPLEDSVWAVGQFGVVKASGPEPVLSALTSLPGPSREIS
jgi:photosystem II stability/assembly factor-like uncharacterized protein